MDIRSGRRRRLLGAGALASAAVLAVVTGSAATSASAQPLHTFPAHWLPTLTPEEFSIV